MKSEYLKTKYHELFGFIKSSAGMLVLSSILANFINFAFNAYLGRRLDLDDFGVITMMSTFVYVLNFFINSMSTTVTYTVSYLEGIGIGRGSAFFRKTWVHIFIPSILSSIAWIFAVPFIGRFLNVSDYSIIASFAPAILFGAFSAYNSAYLSGTWKFGALAILASFEALSKLLLAVVFITVGLSDFVAFSIPLSIILACVGSTVFAVWMYSKVPVASRESIVSDKFSFGFYGASLMKGFSIVMFLSLDVILAKHYIFPAISLIMSMGMLGAIFFEHASVHGFVEAIVKTNVAYFITVFFAYIFYSQLKYAYLNLRDILLVFKKLPSMPTPLTGKMRILFFNWRDTKSVYAGGAETYVQALASRWVKEGHAVTLFTSNDGYLPPNGETDGVRIIRRGGFYVVYVIASLYYLFHFRSKFDVIVDSENGIPFFTPLYAKEPVYCLVHHIHQEVFRKSLIWPLAKFAMFLEKDLMPYVYRHSNFITVSDSSKREMQKLKITNNDIQVVHPGIDTDFLTPGEKSSIPMISYVGRLKEHKSVHLLIKAFKEVLEKVPEAKLIIAGDGEEENKLVQLVRKLKIGR